MSPRLAIAPSTLDHLRGDPSAPVTLLEYGDLACPESRQVHPVLTRLLALSQGRVRLVYRHFPDERRYPNALRAAEATEAAAAQGRFWAAHDRLCEDPSLLPLEDPERFARLLGIDPERFSQHLRDGCYARRVHEMANSGMRSGVRATPSFFINGLMWQGGHDLPHLLDALGLQELHAAG